MHTIFQIIQAVLIHISLTLPQSPSKCSYLLDYIGQSTQRSAPGGNRSRTSRGQEKLTPLLSAVSASRSLLVSSKRIRAHRRRTEASVIGSNLYA